jgi:hypothetical protein
VAVYASRKKANAAAQRSAERRQREDDAQRLSYLIPSLTELRITVTEDSSAGKTKHVKHIIVQRAPALFVIACGDPRCEEGGHDVTSEVMHALRGRQTKSDGESVCYGTIGSAACNRRMHYELTAAYASPS